MFSPLFNTLLIPFIVAMFLAMTMGGSGIGPSFSAAYGANMIRKTAIPGIFGIMVFAGAIIAGKNTSSTLGKDILDPSFLTYTTVTIILFSISLSLLIANIVGVPQSTSQATVLSVVGASIYFHQPTSNFMLTKALPTWFILPIIAFILSYLLARFIYRPLRRRAYFMNKSEITQKYLRYAVIFSSMYVAFSIGSNNVANAAGPMASMVINELNLAPTGQNFLLIMIITTLMTAPVFGIGASVMGNRVIENTGKEIVLFGQIEAIIIAIITATLLLLSSVITGIPTSLVQLNVAAILGVGVAKLGPKNIFRKTQVNRFFVMWVIAPLIAFILTIALLWMANQIGILDL
ncbi:MAG TPA: inorganic phosphate transporter [Salinivirgaceae bacterium]|nr:inorganic phosphate transporter [Salinivirgaceae bacterium]